MAQIRAAFAEMKPITEEFRRALGRFAIGVTVVTVARDDGRVHGMTANVFSSVSLGPLLVLVCIDRRARTYPLIRERRRFGIHVLTRNRFSWTAHGAPVLAGCLAHLDCRVVSSTEAGDHTIFIGEPEHLAVA